MFSKNYLSVILFAAVLCVSSAFSAEGETTSDPSDQSSVFVEGIVVQISSEALAEANISPIGQTQQDIQKIIKYLAQPEKARVISGGKGVIFSGGESTIRQQDMKYVTVKHGSATEVQQYEIDFYLGVVPRFSTQKKATIGYNASIHFFTEDPDGAQYPTTHSYEWQGMLKIESGKPVVAAAVQNQDGMTLLILCATIQE